MPGPAVSTNRVGHPSMNPFAADLDVASMILGSRVFADDIYWGGGEFVFCRSTDAIAQYGLVSLYASFDSTNKKWLFNAAPIPDTANLGVAVGVAMNKCTAADKGVWVKIAGICPVNSAASVAADTAFGIGGAGIAGAVSAGKQILGARIAAPATTTVAKANCSALSGSTKLMVPSSAGWFLGAYLSGTGVASGAYVAAISADGREVTMSAASTARITGTVTATYNNGTVFFNVAVLNHPLAQGQDAT